MPVTGRRAVPALVLVAVLVTAACGGGGGRSATPATRAPRQGLAAEVASYEVVAGHPQRLIAGLLTEAHDLVGFGKVEFSFAYLGTADAPLRTPEPGPTATADYRLIPGESAPATTKGPRVIKPSDGRGVYGADGVTFDRAGLWSLTVTAELAGRQRTAQAAFEVVPTPIVAFPGQPAPRTVNLLPGAKDAPVKAVDSRADAAGQVPDPELHTLTVAQAIASGRPTLLVVSTPVFCVSRFCGPITDFVSSLAKRHAGQMNFVHIEVWRDFEQKQLNAAAGDWIYPGGQGDPKEPWTFLIGGDGMVLQRWDNVATEAELTAAVDGVLR